MSSDIEVLDERSVDGLRPLAADEDPARRYAVAFLHTAPRHYVDNAGGEMKALVVDGKVLPLLVDVGDDGHAAVCSLHAHYFKYPLEEVTKRNPWVPRQVFRALIHPLGVILKTARVDRVIWVNNWLLPTNPSVQLTAAQIGALTARLTEMYPESAIVFRSINPMVDGGFTAALRTNRYRLVRSRRIYMYDLASGQYLDHKNSRRDLRLLKRAPYEVVRDHERLAPHAARFAALYRALYLDKHSYLNPQFNERFFAVTLRERILTYVALQQGESIDGFIAYHVRGNVMTNSILGYNRELPVDRGLFRILYALQMAEAAERGLLLNMGAGTAGTSRFKLLRGGIPVEEFDAVYDCHLSTQRRYAWAALRVTTHLWARARPDAE